MKRLTVIVPCFHPPAEWEIALVERYKVFVNLLPNDVSASLTIVNDGSATIDETESRASLEKENPRIVLISYPVNRGKGFALRRGVEASEADFYVLTDLDFPYTPESMLRLTNTLLQGGGIAAGNRNDAYYARVPAFRRFLSINLRRVLRSLMKLPVDDSQCGLKGFEKRYKELFLQTRINRFLYDLEFLKLAQESGAPVAVVPVELREGVTFNRVSWKTLALESVNFVKILLRSRRYVA